MPGSLIKKEFLLEFRQRAALGGVLVYVAGTIFVSALCFMGRVDKHSWNALFWVISLFTSVTISGKSFLKESGGQALFNFIYYKPAAFIMAKTLYNVVFMLALSLVTYFFYSVFISSVVEDKGLFILTLVLASTGFAAVLSLMSAIAAKAQGNFAIMSILSFPVLMPMVLVVIRLSKHAIDGLGWTAGAWNYILMLGGINLLSLALAFLLFPYLWRE